jgi:hypothetical protein
MMNDAIRVRVVADEGGGHGYDTHGSNWAQCLSGTEMKYYTYYLLAGS